MMSSLSVLGLTVENGKKSERKPKYSYPSVGRVLFTFHSFVLGSILVYCVFIITFHAFRMCNITFFKLKVKQYL